VQYGIEINLELDSFKGLLLAEVAIVMLFVIASTFAQFALNVWHVK
jgi:hypothetical protein